MSNYNLKEWKVKFSKGEFESGDFRTQCDAGWYDWFCKDGSLRNKTKKMGNIIKKLNDSEKVYVWFKNNCPVFDPLYDDFRIADCETGNTLYTITILDKREEHTYNIYGIDNKFEKALLSTNYSKDVVKFLNEKLERIEKEGVKHF